MSRTKGSKNKQTRILAPTNCQKCGKFYVPERNTFGKFCSQACMQNRITKQCPQCGKIFHIRASKVNKYTFCSMICRKTSKTWPTVNCEYCRKPFTVNPARGEKARYCSYECHYATHRGLIICAYCKQQKTVKNYRIAGGVKCCSNRCATLLRMRDGFEPGSFGVKRQSGYHTDIETMTEQVLLKMGIFFIFEHKVRRYSIDFALPELGIALECDGWQHLTLKGREHDLVRNKALENEGWTVIHMSDKSIRENTYTAVTNALKDHISIPIHYSSSSPT